MEAARKVLAALFGVWALAGAIGLGLAVGTWGVLPFVVVPRGRRERYTMRAAQVWAWLVVRVVLCTRVEVHGHWRLPDGQGAILFCNHRSWLDPLLLMAETRSNGLSKREIVWIPVIGLYGYLSGAVFFDRRSMQDRHRARREVMALVKGGHRVQVFPEGTRSVDGTLRQRVFLTSAYDAYQRGIPVVPCAVVGTERVLPPHRAEAWPFRRVVLEIGDPLRPAEYPDAERFALACWAGVTERVCPERDSNPHSREGRGF